MERVWTPAFPTLGTPVPERMVECGCIVDIISMQERAWLADVLRRDNDLKLSIRGRWNRETWHRETWQPGTMSPSLISPSQCVTPWCRGKRLNRTWKCSNEYNSWCSNSHRRVRWRTLRRRQWQDFSIDNGLCQITVQTFNIIIATFPSANTYLCCWRCLLSDYMTVL